MDSKKGNKAELSKGILNMKFMKKTKEKIEKEEEVKESRLMYANEITNKMLEGESKYIIVNSRIPCENLIEGRVSFGGMNPEIERLMKIENGDQPEPKDETQIPDEMLHSTLVESIASNFNKQKRRHQIQETPITKTPIYKKKKFLKPENV